MQRNNTAVRAGGEAEARLIDGYPAEAVETIEDFSTQILKLKGFYRALGDALLTELKSMGNSFQVIMEKVTADQINAQRIRGRFVHAHKRSVRRQHRIRRHRRNPFAIAQPAT